MFVGKALMTLQEILDSVGRVSGTPDRQASNIPKFHVLNFSIPQMPDICDMLKADVRTNVSSGFWIVIG